MLKTAEIEEKTVHAFTDDALGTMDAVAISEALKNGSASQREVVEAAIKRATLVDLDLNAIETDCFDQALKTANRPLGFGQFAGVPTFIKDNTPVKGLPTNHGSHAINSKPATKHDPYASQFLAQGFTLLGKSTLPEFGFNATTEPAHKNPCRNPWHIDHSTGASSGGAAALVAAGAVPLAHANDGGGSIRIPAACCGLIGLKPTRNRHVNADQNKSLPVNIVSEGVVTRSVRDTAYFHAEAEKYYRNPKLPPIGLVTNPGKKKMRIGVIVDSITGQPTDKETREAIDKTASLLSQMGHHLEEIPVPVEKSFIEDFVSYWCFLAFMTDKGGRFIMDASFDSSRLDGLTIGLSQRYKKLFHRTPFFLYRLRKTQQKYAKVFDNLDLILTPVLAHTTPTLGYLSPSNSFDELLERLINYVSFTPLANASGTPAISLPVAHSSLGLPISAQFTANHGNERELLQIAYALEEANPFNHLHTKR